MNAVLLSHDLATASRVEGAALRVGMALRVAANPNAVVEECGARAVTLVLIDLSVPVLEIAKFVDQLNQTAQRPAIVAFGPHVHGPLLDVATAAGCDEVVSRGQFFSQLDQILARVSGAAS